MEQPIEQYRKQIKKEICEALSSFEFMVNNKENRDLLTCKVEEILQKYIGEALTDDDVNYGVNVAVVSTSPTKVELIAADTFTSNLFREIYK